MSGESLLPGPQMASSRGVLTWQKGQGSSGISFIKALIPSLGLPLHDLIAS